MKEIEFYIYNQLQKIKPEMSDKKQMAYLNGIYAVLESRGYDRHEIKMIIEKIIKEKLRSLGKKLKNNLEDLK